MSFLVNWRASNDLVRKEMIGTLPICDPSFIRVLAKIEDDEIIRHIMATFVNSYLADLEYEIRNAKAG